MVADTTIKNGYKQTEVGVIPEDWDVKSIGDISDVDPDNLGSSTNPDYTFKYISLEDVDYGILRNYTELIFKNAPSRARRKIQRGDVLVSTVRPNLKSHLLIQISADDFICSTGFSVLRCKNYGINSEYVFNHFFSSIINKQIDNLITGSNYPAISSKDVKALLIPIPPTKSEQTAIATVLSDTDALIESLEKLISKKKAIKQGTMQQLLTGKKRLPGFSGEWVVKRFSDVMEGFSSGQTPYRAIKEYYSGNIPWITSGELNYNIITETKEKITEKAVRNTNLKILPIGTFLFAITGLEAEGTRGSCAITGIEATTNQSCMALYPMKGQLITEYLYHYYAQYGNKLAFEYCQGTKQQSYTGGIAKKLPIILPPTLEEQTAIAAVLSDMDAEIESLEQKRDKYSKIKQGMMQQLLTGKIRLV